MKIRRNALIASFTLHVLAALIIFLHFSFSPTAVKLEKKGGHLAAYLYQENPFISPAIVKNEPAPSPIKKITPDLALQKKSTRKHALKKSLLMPQKTLASVPEETVQGTQKDELLALLHTAIQKEQQYPPSALQMEREGRAKIEFILYADGSISHLRLIESSGTASLDEAALAAIHRASPFQHIQSYLHAPQKFNIDVVFAL